MNRKDILLVDDNIDLLKALSLLLRSEGFDVVEACDPGKALKMMNSNTFDMLITDFQMPQMTGVELAVEATKQNPDIHVVMVTAHDPAGIAEATDIAGISEILVKPVAIKSLLAAIESFIPLHPAFNH